MFNCALENWAASSSELDEVEVEPARPREDSSSENWTAPTFSLPVRVGRLANPVADATEWVAPTHRAQLQVEATTASGSPGLLPDEVVSFFSGRKAVSTNSFFSGRKEGATRSGFT